MTDEELSQHFAALKRHDREAAPSFDRMWAAPARSRSRLAVPIAAVAVAAAIVLAIAWPFSVPPSTPPAAIRPADGDDAPRTEPTALPLDFLLDPPPAAKPDPNLLPGW